jgi:ankyrin repeat protein
MTLVTLDQELPVNQTISPTSSIHTVAEPLWADESRPLSRVFCDRFLLSAVNLHQTFIVSEIVARGDIDIDINVRSNYGQTALSIAAERGYIDIVTLLLSHPSIDVNAQDLDRQTALGWAIYNGRDQVVALLLQDPSVRTDMMDIDGMTPWTWAIEKRRRIILVLLFKRLGIDPDQ